MSSEEKSNKKGGEDAEDHEIFDIIDFTTASDWERFIVQIEELINEWKLNSLDKKPSDYVNFLLFLNIKINFS
jgi:hypothetical protein